MVKKESKEKRESNEESKENVKAKSDDSGEEKNGDDDSQKNGPKKKGDQWSNWFNHLSIIIVLAKESGFDIEIFEGKSPLWAFGVLAFK